VVAGFALSRLVFDTCVAAAGAAMRELYRCTKTINMPYVLLAYLIIQADLSTVNSCVGACACRLFLKAHCGRQHYVGTRKQKFSSASRTSTSIRNQPCTPKWSRDQQSEHNSLLFIDVRTISHQIIKTQSYRKRASLAIGIPGLVQCSDARTLQ
jgi:hypothetical protein